MVTTQDPLGHWVVPGAHIEPHTPALQTSPGWQGMLQPAQFRASDEMQVLLQLSNPGWHWQDPLWQVCPAAQALPQPPQFCGSEAVFTQAVPQEVCAQGAAVPPVPPAPPVPGVAPEPDFVQAATKNVQPKTALRTTSLTLFMVLVRKCPQRGKPITKKFGGRGGGVCRANVSARKACPHPSPASGRGRRKIRLRSPRPAERGQG